MRDKKVRLSPPPTPVDTGLPYQWLLWFESFFNRVGAGPFLIQGYNVTEGLPDPSEWFSNTSGNSFTGVILVVGSEGGPTLAFSNGSNWLRVRDNGIIS